RDPVDAIRVGLVELLEELTGVWRERLDVTPLALHVDRVECQRALPRAADSGHGDQAIEGQIETQPLEIMGPHAAQVDLTRGVDGHRLLFPISVRSIARTPESPIVTTLTRTENPDVLAAQGHDVPKAERSPGSGLLRAGKVARRLRGPGPSG